MLGVCVCVCARTRMCVPVSVCVFLLLLHICLGNSRSSKQTVFCKNLQQNSDIKWGNKKIKTLTTHTCKSSLKVYIPKHTEAFYGFVSQSSCLWEHTPPHDGCTYSGRLADYHNRQRLAARRFGYNMWMTF